MFFFCTIARDKRPQEIGIGRIDDFGNYKYRDLNIQVNEVDDQVEYLVWNAKGDTLITCDDRFNKFQKWALHIDSQRNLWVFSSDIGHSCWYYDSIGHFYNKHEFQGRIGKSEMSNDVYVTLSDFYPYSMDN